MNDTELNDWKAQALTEVDGMKRRLNEPMLQRIGTAKPSEARRVFVTCLTRWAWSFDTLAGFVEFAHEEASAVGSHVGTEEAEHLARVIWAREYPERIDTDPISEQELVSVKSLREKVLEVYRTGGDRGVSPGWTRLEPLYRIRRGEWTLITGIPGHGKTAFLDAMLLNLIRREHWRIGIFSAEQWPLERHVLGLCEKLTGQPARRGPTAMMNEETLGAALNALDESVSFFCPRDNNRTLDRILAIAQEAVATRGILGVVIDPWNEIDHQRPRDLAETEYVSRALSKIRRFAQTNLVHCWLIAHPTKLQRKTDGTYPVPTPYDVSGSAHFRAKADNALCVYRHEKDEHALSEIYVQKIRHRDVGRVGMCELQFNPVSGGFDDPADQHPKGDRP